MKIEFLRYGATIFLILDLVLEVEGYRYRCLSTNTWGISIFKMFDTIRIICIIIG